MVTPRATSTTAGAENANQSKCTGVTFGRVGSAASSELKYTPHLSFRVGKEIRECKCILTQQGGGESTGNAVMSVELGISCILFLFLLTLRIIRVVRFETRGKTSQQYTLVLLVFTCFSKYRATPLEKVLQICRLLKGYSELPQAWDSTGALTDQQPPGSAPGKQLFPIPKTHA